MRRTFLTALVPLAMMAACSPGDAPAQDATATEAPASVVEVSDAYVILPAPGRDVSAGFLTLSVTGEPLRLTGATTDIAETVELHTMAMVDDRMQMRKVEEFEVSEDAPLELKRGGNHLMLFGMRPDLVAGETADIVLTLTDDAGAEQTIVAEAEIRAFGD